MATTSSFLRSTISASAPAAAPNRNMGMMRTNKVSATKKAEPVICRT